MSRGNFKVRCSSPSGSAVKLIYMFGWRAARWLRSRSMATALRKYMTASPYRLMVEIVIYSIPLEKRFDFGFWILDFGFAEGRFPESKIQNPKSKIQNPKSKALASWLS